MIDGELVAFHFGVLEGDARAAVEEHLASCPRCLRAFLDVKRALERVPDERPSDRVRARLRAEAARRFARPRAWWWIGGAAAAAAVLLAIALRAPSLPSVGANAAVQVDTAAPESPSLNVW
jgi:anti-sigma factor RsiW